MSWQKYQLCFRLESALHIGFRTVANLKQTRPYVPSKNLWACLTARLTRDIGKGAEGHHYVTIGNEVAEHFRFGYLYPALPKCEAQTIQSSSDLIIYYPWEDGFDYRFLSSYASTALNYDQRSAAEGLLHETEFIRPWTRPLTGTPSQPVYLVGDLYVRQELHQCLANWQTALRTVQIGGEQGYGWGRLRLCHLCKRGVHEEPLVQINKSKPCLAHVEDISESDILGPVEPIVGWGRNPDQSSDKTWHLSAAKICYVPESIVTTDKKFQINQSGYLVCL